MKKAACMIDIQCNKNKIDFFKHNFLLSNFWISSILFFLNRQMNSFSIIVNLYFSDYRRGEKNFFGRNLIECFLPIAEFFSPY